MRMNCTPYSITSGSGEKKRISGLAKIKVSSPSTAVDTRLITVAVHTPSRARLG